MHFVLYVRDTKVDVFRLLGKQQIEHKAFSWADLTEFVDKLSANARISLVLDLVDEDLQVEYMPSLLPWEKYALQKRLAEKWQQKGVVAQRFIWAGEKKLSEDGRMEELLVTSLLYPFKPLQKLLDQLIERHALLIGIHSAAFLLKRFFDKELSQQLKLKGQQKKAPIMLVARMTPTHYRQCFFYQGQLRLTRLVEMEERAYTEQETVDFLASETKLATRFIYNQKILPLGAAFNFVVLDHMTENSVLRHWEAFERVGSVISNQWDAEQNFFDVVNLLDHVSMPRDDLCFGHALLANELYRGLTPSFYQLSYIKKINRFRGFGAALKLAALSVFLLALFSMVTVWLQSHYWQKHSELYQTTIQRLDAEKQHLIAAASDRVLPDDMKASVEMARVLTELNQARPYGAPLMKLSALLARHPKIKLQSLVWKPESQADSAMLVLSLKGWVYPFNGEYKPITQAVNAFMDDLQAQAGVDRVKLKQKPFNQDQTQTLNVSPSSGMNALPFAIEWRINTQGMNGKLTQ